MNTPHDIAEFDLVKEGGIGRLFRDLGLTSPLRKATGTPDEPGSIAAAYDVRTEAGRRLIFNEIVSQLTKPKSEGGHGLTLDKAIFEMRGTQGGRELLFLMGGSGHDQEHQALLDRMGEVSRHETAHGRVHPLATSSSAAEARRIAFNQRLDELTGKGFSIDQAIAQMRANDRDAALLEAMNVEAQPNEQRIFSESTDSENEPTKFR